MNVPDDLALSGSAKDPTAGSGGGLVGSGFGGGRVYLKAGVQFELAPSGRILAEGSAAANPSLGAGSGGSVSIIAGSLIGSGNISVAGGDSSSTVAAAAAAGGGGRVSIQVCACLPACVRLCLIVMESE